MDRTTILVAGGTGKRMGASLPKQFLLLHGEPLLFHTLRTFHAFDPHMPLVLVLPADHHTTWEDLCGHHDFDVPHSLVAGGTERFHSTLEGLRTVDHEGLVAVHDGVRPLLSTSLIARCFAAAEEHGAAIPVLPIPYSVRELTKDNSRAIDRTPLRAVQTPQCFQVSLLRRAFELPFDPAFTDEATLVERLGVKVELVEGEDHNIKVTTPFDLQVAEMMITGRG